MEAIPLASLQIPLSPPPPFPWVADVMAHRLAGGHSPHDHRNHYASSVPANEPSDEGPCHGHGELIKTRRRPARLAMPEYFPADEFSSARKTVENVQFEIQGRDYCLVSRKGRRENMEDRFRVITDISGDPNQAFFAVIDGHGGQAAADYVAENLGKNILKSLENVRVEEAIREGYFQTDREFLSQGVGSGACATSVLLRNGELHTANVGDCRVVMRRRGLATRLTNDHHLSREDERSRIENSGGFVQNHNGVWRVQGSLAVSRAIGDIHLKEWIISEPEIEKVHLTSDCEFLIVASDGLWDKVTDQEAVNVISEEESAVESCKKLADIASSRGNRDDITIILINLQKFVAAAGFFES